MSEPFVTLETFSDFVGQDLTEDEAAEIAIDAACQLIRTYLDRQVNFIEDEAIRVSGSGTDIILLPNWPIRNITSITIDGEELDELNENDEENWRFGASGLVFRLDTYVWPRGHENIEVVYSSGWPFDEEFTDDVPADIKLVAILVAKRIYALREVSASGALKTSETIGRYSYTLSDAQEASGGGLIESERAALDRYADRRM
jgi:hypothetical protein